MSIFFGSILTSSATFFEEIFDTIGKKKVRAHKESVYTMACLSLLWGSVFLLFYGGFSPQGFLFHPASIPFLLVRIILEIVQMYVTILGIVQADRSLFSLVRMLTIPFLLLVDLLLGYSIGFFAFVGIACILSVFVLLVLMRRIEKKGMGYALFSAGNAVITFSLYKYNIAHFNSVASEQLLVHAVLIVFFFWFAMTRAHENPFRFLLQPVFFLQSISCGIASTLESIACSFAPVSLMAAVKRSSALFWALISGKYYFHERFIWVKALLATILIVGLIFISFSGS